MRSWSIDRLMAAANTSACACSVAALLLWLCIVFAPEVHADGAFVGTAPNGSLVLQPANHQVLVDGVEFQSLLARLASLEQQLKASTTTPVALSMIKAVTSFAAPGTVTGWVVDDVAGHINHTATEIVILKPGRYLVGVTLHRDHSSSGHVGLTLHGWISNSRLPLWRVVSFTSAPATPSAWLVSVSASTYCHLQVNDRLSVTLDTGVLTARGANINIFFAVRVSA